MPASMAATAGIVMSVQQQQQQLQQQQACGGFPLLSMQRQYGGPPPLQQQQLCGGPLLMRCDDVPSAPPPGAEQRPLPSHAGARGWEEPAAPEDVLLQGPCGVRDTGLLPQQHEPASRVGLRFLLNAELLVGDPDCAMVRPPSTPSSSLEGHEDAPPSPPRYCVLPIGPCPHRDSAPPPLRRC